MVAGFTDKPEQIPEGITKSSLTAMGASPGTADAVTLSISTGQLMFDATHLDPHDVLEIIDYLSTLKDLGESTKQRLETLKKQAEQQVEEQKEEQKQKEEEKQKEDHKNKQEDNEKGKDKQDNLNQ